MITVRPFDAGATEAFRALYHDCLAHYGEARAAPDLEADLIAELSAPHGTFVDLAWDGERAVGFSCWMRVFPAGNGFALYMKELYVLRDARGCGVGKALMRSLARRAVEMGAQSVRWESGEPEAMAFYGRLGDFGNGKTSYTASESLLCELAEIASDS